MKTRELIEQRLEVLKQARAAHLVKVNHLDGAVAELEHILAQGVDDELCADGIGDNSD